MLTPAVQSGLLPGITRELIFEVGRDAGIEAREQALRDDDLFNADEVFLTSATREVVPIVAVNERVIGNGEPGTVTRQLLEAFCVRARAG